ncbi:hypothetical protein HanRHA438_Chr08g0339131 [Helianthus annuus]|nr:hypothetical protein HanRHA438_Chr08g0339131 [Helianthus annuus]
MSNYHITLDVFIDRSLKWCPPRYALSPTGIPVVEKRWRPRGHDGGRFITGCR